MDGGTSAQFTNKPEDWNQSCCCKSGSVCVSQVDNKGNHLLVHEESSINVPAIAAAHVIKRYIAQASDELSFEVNIKTVIIMV